METSVIDISIVIPVYRGEKTIKKLFQEIKTVFEKSKLTYEVIFVWDYGPDNSWTTIKELKAAYPDKITGIRFSRNFGQHNALICGFEYCKGKVIASIDEDLQHSPTDIIKLYDLLEENDYDVVYGKYETLKHNPFRNLTSIALKFILSKAIPTLHKDYSAFRILKRDIALSTVTMQNAYTFLDGYLSWITNNVGSVKISHRKRLAGESSYNLRKLVEHSINILITFSNLPIRFLTYTSLLFFVVALLYSVYIVSLILSDIEFSAGFPSLIISILMGFSFVLLGLGVIGEYLYSVNLKSTKRPNYIVSKKI